MAEDYKIEKLKNLMKDAIWVGNILEIKTTFLSLVELIEKKNLPNLFRLNRTGVLSDELYSKIISEGYRHRKSVREAEDIFDGIYEEAKANPGRPSKDFIQTSMPPIKFDDTILYDLELTEDRKATLTR